MKILIVKASSLGDIIQSFPCVAYLRKKFPLAQIDWVVEKKFAELLHAHPELSRILEFDTYQWRHSLFSCESWRELRQFSKILRDREYDVVFDLQGNYKSSLFCGLARSKIKIGFGSSTASNKANIFFTNRRVDPLPEKNIREDYLALIYSYCGVDAEGLEDQVTLKITREEALNIQAILQSLPVDRQPFVMVCPGSAWPNKQLNQKALIDFLTLLNEKLSCSYLFVWGTDKEKGLADYLKTLYPATSLVVDRMSLPALQNLMSHMQWVIAMDSLPLHLAGTTTTSTFSVFGASLGRKYAPIGVHHQFLQGGCPYGNTFDKRCSVLRTCSSGACIKTLSGQDLFEAFLDSFPLNFE